MQPSQVIWPNVQYMYENCQLQGHPGSTQAALNYTSNYPQRYLTTYNNNNNDSVFEERQTHSSGHHKSWPPSQYLSHHRRVSDQPKPQLASNVNVDLPGGVLRQNEFLQSVAEAAQANYLAQVAQANQLELLLAAEAQRQHDAAIAVMHAHQHHQQQQREQQLASVLNASLTSSDSLEDIYCSSTSEASGPSSSALSSCLHGLSSNAAVSPNLELELGTRVAVKKYEVIRPLGVGTYGKVKLTKDVNTKQLVSLRF